MNARAAAFALKPSLRLLEICYMRCGQILLDFEVIEYKVGNHFWQRNLSRKCFCGGGILYV